MNRTWMAALTVLLLAFACAAAEPAATAPPSEKAGAEDLLTTIEALKQRNRDLERRLTELEARIGEGTDVQRLRREEVRMLVEQALAESKSMFAPGWLENLKFGGDLRLRYEYRRRAAEQRDDDGRYRFRLRFGIVKTWPKEDMEIGFRIVSGADNDPTSTNQTFENMFQEYAIGVDQVFAKWTPRQVKGLTVIAGKMPQPWQTTDLIWDSDVNPDGAWLAYKFPGLGPFEPFVGAGIFTLNYDDRGVANAGRPESTLAAYEMGFNLKLPHGVVWTSSVNAYDFTHVQSLFRDVGFAARGNTVAGNLLLADGFQLWVLTNKVSFKAFNLPITLVGEFVHNSDNQDVRDNSNGWMAGVRIGQNKKKGDWQFAAAYRYLQSDAVLAFFSESDFGNGTHTNRKGCEFKLSYNITDNMTAGVALFATQPIDVNVPGGPAEWDRTRFTFQADLVWKF